MMRLYNLYNKCQYLIFESCHIIVSKTVVFGTLHISCYLSPPQEQPIVSKPISESTFHYLHSFMSFDTVSGMEDGKKKMLTAKMSVALLDELGRIATREEIERYARAERELYKA